MIIHLKINDVSDLKIDVSDQMRYDMQNAGSFWMKNNEK